MKPSMTIDVSFKGRRALYTPTKFNAIKYNLVGKTVDVEAFGIFQVKEDEDIDAYFVVKLPDGRCCYAGVDQIQFVEDKEEDTE